ncbi:MAG: DUF2179 domain-containing protein [Candidatus Hydrogenedentes bacterium]|nr:DUF2179 domain-containing protein [Candidatus Hydrogenedentota bacterium]
MLIAYSGGFATGNIVGIWLESHLALGSELVRTVSGNLQADLGHALRSRGYSVTALSGKGDDGRPVEVNYVVVKRREVPKLLSIVPALDPEAIWTRSDVKGPPVGAVGSLRAGLLN